MDEQNKGPIIAMVCACAILVCVILAVNLFGGSSGSSGDSSGESSGDDHAESGAGGAEQSGSGSLGAPADSVPTSDSGAQAELMRVLYDFDITSPEALTARSDVVFVGEVSEKVANRPLQTTIEGFSEPRSQYEVEVAELISGDIGGSETVVVEQRGGYDEEGVPVVVEANSGEGGLSREQATDELLKPGQTYLFVVTAPAQARDSSVENPYQIVAQPTGNIMLAAGDESRRIVESFRQAADR